MVLDWSRTLAGKGPEFWENDMCVFDGALYVVGETNDPDKTRASGGGYWQSGFAARLSLSGEVAWEAVAKATSCARVDGPGRRPMAAATRPGDAT